jgi:hypothetical protein
LTIIACLAALQQLKHDTPEIETPLLRGSAKMGSGHRNIQS